MNIKIPVYKPFFNGSERKYVDECIDSTWISSKGKFVTLFEQSFADYIGVNYSVAVTNGTSAIHLALLALGIGPGDEVIVPSLTYIASVNPISYVGATPIFVDSDERTWQIDPEDVRKKITNRTKAIIAVHLYGHPADMRAIMQIAKESGVFVIEDCAEAIGTEFEGKRVGSFGDISCFSFFGNKTITTGEGGMLLTNDKTIFSRSMSLKGQGLAMYREYWHDIIGYNYRMTNICAAIGYAQMETVDNVIEKKRKIAFAYKEMLKDTGVSLFVGDDGKDGILNTYWMCTIQLEKDGEQRDDLRKHLLDNGIETRPVFYPVHTMPTYSRQYQKLSVAESVGWRGINLPSFPDLTNDEIEFVVDKIKDFYGGK